MSQESLRTSLRILLSSGEGLPRREELEGILKHAQEAQERGYFLPDEDDLLCEVFARYLGARYALWETVLTLRPLLDERRNPDWELRLRAFAMAFCSAAMLVRSGSFLVETARQWPVVWTKLDAAESRFGIERKSFTRVYKSLSSARWMWRYYEAAQFYDLHREEIRGILGTEVEGANFTQIWDWLKEEEPWIEKSKRDYMKRRVRYKLFSFKRRHLSGYKKVMFHLFRLSGSAIAEMRQPLVKGVKSLQKTGEIVRTKRVTDEVCEAVRPLLRPGDVLVTRHDDAMSNLFLPGYWPHAALYIGGFEEREELGVTVSDEVASRSGGGIRVLEAKKDGVLFRRLEETLFVDAFIVMRPKVPEGQLREALSRAMTHEGKLYDFLFDFSKGDRLACTEVVYRSFHGVGDLRYILGERAGRKCLSAEDLIHQSLENGWFEVIAGYGIEDDVLRHGEAADKRLRASLRKWGEKAGD